MSLPMPDFSCYICALLTIAVVALVADVALSFFITFWTGPSGEEK